MMSTLLQVTILILSLMLPLIDAMTLQERVEKFRTAATNGNARLAALSQLTAGSSREERFSHVLQVFQDTRFQGDVIASGAVMILAGLFFLLFGVRLFKTTLITVGFATGAGISALIVQALQNHDLIDLNTWAMFGICTAAGIITAVLAWRFYKASLTNLGTLMGVAFAAMIFSWAPGGLLSDSWARGAVTLVCASIGGFLALKCENHVIIFGTSILGGILLMMGVDSFLATGVLANIALMIMTIMERKPTEDESQLSVIKDSIKEITSTMPREALMMLGVGLGVMFLSVIVQYKYCLPKSKKY